jgi:Activator of Hsp90 ATPase homolog 1-like protein
MSYGINHQVGVKAPPEEIYTYLTENAKLAQWRTTETRGSGAKVGDTLEFWFPGGICQKFDVKGLEPGKRIVWKSPKGQGADEWERLKLPSICRRTRSRPSFSFVTWAGEKVRAFKGIAR